MLEEKPLKGPLSELSEEEFDTFIVILGKLVYRTPAVGSFARHISPLNTVRDYYHVKEGASKVERFAQEFWKDLASRKMNSRELCMKWVGEEVPAQEAFLPEETKET